ncbi:MAG: hypothetical protein J6K23_00940 [Bacilli bacterium]|nr:hypothetical protein [Bacilli bacterium]
MNFLLRLFKKEKHNIGVIRFGDNLVIPGRKYFKDEKDIILLENYKKHYLEILKNRTVVTTPYFNSKSLKEQMNMYIDLLLGLVMDNNNFCEYSPEELLVQIAKLKMYYDEMIVLKNEIILRLIALKEIKKEKRIPRHNKMALEEEINSLSVILEMFIYREASINIEIKNYFDVLATRDLSEVDESLLNERLTRLLFFTKGIVDENKLYDDIKLNVALLEKECEMYAYTHKDEALRLKESYDLNDESKILLFYEYGKDIFDHDFVKEFYLYKFNLLVTDINNSCNESPINVKDYGFLFYIEIIGDKINNLDKSYYFNDLIDKNVDISEQLDGSREYLKTKDGIFDYEEILKNKYKLAFLVSLEYENGIKDYFNKNIIDVKTDNEWNKYNKYIDFVEFKNKVHLSTLYELFATDKDKHILYSIYEANRLENNLLIPYGVKRINLNLLPHEYIKRIEKEVNSRKKYTFPNSLKSIRGAMDYFGYDFSNLYFPDGLEELMIGYNATIPSSVEILKRSSDKHIGYIKFRDFKNSKIVNDKEKFIKFLEDFSEEIDTNKTDYHTPSSYSLEVQRKYRTGRFTTQDYAALFDKPYTIYVFKQKMLFTSLYFLDDNLDNPIVINGKDIELEFDKTTQYYYSRRSKVIKEDLSGCADFNKIYEKIRRIIIEQSGYDIASREIVDNKKLIYDKRN